MTGAILTVSQMTERIKHLLEMQFPYIWVQGEVTNLTRPGSGHVYFGLKDGDALLGCVWFRGRQRDQERVDPLTGEVFEDGPRPSLAHSLKNGQTIICAGQLSVYAPRGGYQLIVDMAQGSGDGLLHQAFEELKQKLLAQGLFDRERKRTLPAHPQRVALVTSPTGAAVQDFIRVAANRGCGCEIRIYPALVQGDEAPGQIVDALARAAADSWNGGKKADIIVLARGGGSLQDLWAFNSEAVARAIHDSPIPVITGLGHEIDTTIADLVADVRAATPSHAAQILWPEREWFEQRTDELEASLTRAFANRLGRLAETTTRLEQGLFWLSPLRQLHRHEDQLNACTQRISRTMPQYLTQSANRIETVKARLLRQGDSILHHAQEHFERSAAGLLRTAKSVGQSQTEAFFTVSDRLHVLGNASLERTQRDLATLERALEKLDPMAPLQRGYALVRNEDGQVLRSAAQTRLGSRLNIQVLDGTLSTTVDEVELNNGNGLP